MASLYNNVWAQGSKTAASCKIQYIGKDENAEIRQAFLFPSAEHNL